MVLDDGGSERYIHNSIKQVTSKNKSCFAFLGETSNELDTEKTASQTMNRNERILKLKVVQALAYSLLKVKHELLSKLQDIPADSDDTDSVEQLRRLRM